MAFGVIENARLLVGGYDLSGAISAVRLSETAPVVEASVLADSAVSRRAGLPGLTLAASGFCDPDIEPGLAAGLALSNVPVSVVPDDTEGEVAYAFPALLATLAPLGGDIDDMAEMDFDAESDLEAPARGILAVHRTVTASGTGTAFQVDPGGYGRLLRAALHVTSASVDDTLDVVIQSAADQAFTSPATRLSFAQKSAIGYEWATSAAGVNPDTWFRAKWTVAGASPSFTFAVTMEVATTATTTATDLFTDADGTGINQHTPTSGWTSWRQGTAVVPFTPCTQIVGNKARAVTGVWGGEEHVLAAPALVDDLFGYEADIIPAQTGTGAGLRFRCNNQLLALRDYSQVRFNAGAGVASTKLVYGRYVAGALQGSLQNSATWNEPNLLTAGLHLVLFVGGTTIQAYTEPYGGGALTLRATFTATTADNDGAHKQFGLERGSNPEIGTTWDNLVLTYLA